MGSMSEKPKTQADKFRDMARALECDEDEEAEEGSAGAAGTEIAEGSQAGLMEFSPMASVSRILRLYAAHDGLSVRLRWAFFGWTAAFAVNALAAVIYSQLH